jgi:plasmid stabilization system protein ParE
MTYIIDFIPRADADLDAVHESLSAYSERTADKTVLLIKDAILSLSDFPRRFAVAPESLGASIEIRHLVVGNYRVLYQIIGDKVQVMRIVHAAQDTLKPIDLM